MPDNSGKIGIELKFALKRLIIAYLPGKRGKNPC
jgi:hypothetical protein